MSKYSAHKKSRFCLTRKLVAYLQNFVKLYISKLDIDFRFSPKVVQFIRLKLQFYLIILILRFTLTISPIFCFIMSPEDVFICKNKEKETKAQRRH